MFRIARNKFFLPASWGRLFVVTLVFIIVASGLFWLDFFRSYKAEIAVLVVPKPGISGASYDIASTMADLTQTLSFYERVLSDNDRINDTAFGLTPQERKRFWNETVSVERTSGSSLLTLQATGDTAEQAALIARQTVATLLAVTGFYYNIKTEVDVRIVDGPFVSHVLQTPLLWIVVSIFCGIAVTVLFFWILTLIPGFIGGRQENVNTPSSRPVADTPSDFAIGESVPWIDPQKFVPTKPKSLSFENFPIEEHSAVAPVAHAPKRAQAPMNLPTADERMDLPVADEEALPFEFEARPEEIEMSFVEPRMEETEASAPASEMSAPANGEPTAEEYKRRLNELLAGER